MIRNLLLASAALALDFVDGQVARRTGTVSALGARLDGEVDAFLMLALSVAVAPVVGAWVLAIGGARYAFLGAGWLFAWLRAPLPRRDWRKVVTAVAGIALTTAAAEVMPVPATRVVLAVALALLAESFGRDVWWLWQRRHATHAAPAARDRGLEAAVLTVLALLIVWLALVAPNQPSRLTPGAFVRLPLEGIVVVALALVLAALTWRLVERPVREWRRRAAAAAAGGARAHGAGRSARRRRRPRGPASAAAGRRARGRRRGRSRTSVSAGCAGRRYRAGRGTAAG